MGQLGKLPCPTVAQLALVFQAKFDGPMADLFKAPKVWPDRVVRPLLLALERPRDAVKTK